MVNSPKFYWCVSGRGGRTGDDGSAVSSWRRTSEASLSTNTDTMMAGRKEIML